MATETPHPRIGVGAIVRDEEGSILIGKRMGSHGSGTWALPGGHLEFGESHFVCAERETLEETGLHVKALKVVGVTNDMFHDLGKHYVTLFVACELVDPSEKPQIMEPEKCEVWQWISWAEVKDWASHQHHGSANYADKKLFLPMVHLARDYPQLDGLS